MGGDSVAADLRKARHDSSIKAIVLRVDSGGGSVVASEVIRREVELAHEVEAGSGFHVGCGRVGRLLDCGARGQNCRRPQYDHRVDWRADRQDESFGAI